MYKRIIIFILLILSIFFSISCYGYDLQVKQLKLKLHEKENVITSLERQANYYKNEYLRITTEIIDKQNYEVEEKCMKN